MGDVVIRYVEILTTVFGPLVVCLCLSLWRLHVDKRWREKKRKRIDAMVEELKKGAKKY